MRIMLTVLDERGDRDVVVEGDDTITVARVAEALGGPDEPLAKVVRLSRARAPYGLSDDEPPSPERSQEQPRIPSTRDPYPTQSPEAAQALEARIPRPSRTPRSDAPSPTPRSDIPSRTPDPGDRPSALGDPTRHQTNRPQPPGARPRGLGQANEPLPGEVHIPSPRAPSRRDGLGQEGPTLWRNGRATDPRAPARAVLRDGDRVTLDHKLARKTVVDEPSGVAEIRVVGGPGAGSVHRLGLGVHVIGSDAMCAIAVPDPALAPEAAIVRITPEAITVEPVIHRPPPPRPRLKGRYAEDVADLVERAESAEIREAPGEAQLAGAPLTTAADWPEHELLTCGSSILALTAIEPPDAHLAPRAEGGVAYNRPPRLRHPEPERAFERPREPRRGDGIRLQLLAALLPAVLGLTLCLVLGQWYYLLIAFMSPLIMIGQWWSDRRHGRKQHRQAVKQFAIDIAAFDDALDKARRQDERARRSAAPDPAEVLLTATGPRRRLWERRIHDTDALRLRVGLADLPANLEVTQEQGDPLDPPLCRAVPVALPMRRLGVAGVTGPRNTATALVNWLIGQAATLHSPRDLAIVVLSAHADGHERWGWVRWLPHCMPQSGQDCVALVGADPEGAARRVGELAMLIDERLNTTIPDFGKIPTGWDDLGGPETPKEAAFATYDQRPFDVLVVLDGAQVLRGLPGMPQVLRHGPRAGVYTLAVDDDQRLLPEECATVAACGPDDLVRLRGGGLDALGPILADQVSPSWCDRLARALAPIRDVSREDPAGHLPDAARLLDLLNLAAPTGAELAARWRPTGTTRAMIGVGPDGPFAVDLSLDGPHGLVAGTTGAGKSELLQTLISSLAVANRPDQLTFVLIDYKGGAAFKECVRLPHTVGMVSDLDGHLTRRALDSLAAEIRRRERLLLAAGAKDIDDYLEQVAPTPSPPSSPATARWGNHPPRGPAGLWGVHPSVPEGNPAAGLRGSHPPESRNNPAPGPWDDPTAGSQGNPARSQGADHSPWSQGGAEPGAQATALPRLVLIIDEFAALVAELPDFVAGLVDIARRGRSLGIHLILATQRPAGVVTADIQANTSLRIALRVTEPAESADVIDLPDAAHISKSTPGRCYVKSGAGAAQAVQTARIGGRGGAAQGTGPVRVIEVDWRTLGKPLPTPKEQTEESADTDLTVLADALIEAARLAGVPDQPSPWLDPLPSHVVLDYDSASGHQSGVPSERAFPRDARQTPGSPSHGTPFPNDARPSHNSPGRALTGSDTAQAASLDAGEVGPLRFGVTDMPWAQDRRPLAFDLEHGGHLLIAGTSRSGRSTALRTIAGAIAASASPQDVQLHAIDCGSGALLPLVALPHCGAVVTRDQLDRVERLLARLRAEVGRRQQLLAEAGHASLAEYRRAGHRLPWLVLMLDRWEGFVAAFEGYDYGRLTEALLQLLREGPAVGLRAVVTGDRSALLGQVSTVFDDRLLLRLADPADYGLAGLPIKDLPSSMPQGRALSLGEHGIVESQIALLCTDPSGPAQVAELQSLARRAWTPEPAHRSTAPNGPRDADALLASGDADASDTDALPAERSDGAAPGPGTRGANAGTRGDDAGVRGGDPSALGGDAGGRAAGGRAAGAQGPDAGVQERDAGGRGAGGRGGDAGGRGAGGRAADAGGRGGWVWGGEPPLRVDALPMRITERQALDLAPGFVPPSPLWALVGAGGDSLAPLGVDLLAHGPGAVIAGPARSGRSSVLLTAARSLISYGTPVIAIVPRRSPLRELEGALAVLDGNGNGLQDLIAERERYVVVVDDAELLNPDAPLGLVLDEVLRTGRDGEHGLIIAGATGDLATAYRGFVAETRKSRTGLLLSVQSPADGDLFTVRLPRGAVGGPQGRGLLVTMGAMTPIQTALPT